jgi:hypothetical protein
MEREFKGDSYVVNVTPTGSTFPAVQIIRRKKVRQRGQVAQDVDLGMIGRASDYTSDEGLDALARQIGRIILDDSELVQQFRRRGNRE